MLSWMNMQGVRSDQGFEVQFPDRFTAEYREGVRYLVVDVEASGNGQIAFNKNAFVRWANSSIGNDPAEQARILENFKAALEFQGFKCIS